MDVHFLYRDQPFVWDAHKARENRQKHGISFEVACEVFFDDLSAFVDASVPNEQRLAVIGMTDGGDVLYVVHVEREAETIRIISAREADTRERKEYEDG